MSLSRITMTATVDPSQASARPRPHGEIGLPSDEVSNQFSATESVVTVADQVSAGVISAIFGWQGPNERQPPPACPATTPTAYMNSWLTLGTTPSPAARPFLGFERSWVA
jgi:hypothetical protein